MSAIRDNARKILDAALPGATVITSNESKYFEMTGLSQKALTDNWAGGGIMTGCNGFTGWYGRMMGSKTYLGVFDLQGAAKKAGKPEAWISSTTSNHPTYGDIIRYTRYHVDVCLGFDGDVLLRAAGGQGGPSTGYDTIKRARGNDFYDHGPYNPAKLQGWIDIDIYFGATIAPAVGDADMAWLHGWWTVWDGNTYYYFFYPQGVVQYTKTKPAANAPPPAQPLNTGKYMYTSPGSLVIDWNPAGGGATRETFRNAFRNATQMNATSNRYAPLVATRIR
jgi:hypothetical protein